MREISRKLLLLQRGEVKKGFLAAMNLRRRRPRLQTTAYGARKTSAHAATRNKRECRSGSGRRHLQSLPTPLCAPIACAAPLDVAWRSKTSWLMLAISWSCCGVIVVRCVMSSFKLKPVGASPLIPSLLAPEGTALNRTTFFLSSWPGEDASVARGASGDCSRACSCGCCCGCDTGGG